MGGGSLPDCITPHQGNNLWLKNVPSLPTGFVESGFEFSLRAGSISLISHKGNFSVNCCASGGKKSSGLLILPCC